MMNLQELMLKAKEVTKSGLPFMEGLDKADFSMGEIYHINNFGYMEGEDGEFVVVTTKEYSKKFFFGSSVLTSKMKELEAVFSSEQLDQLLEAGIEVVFEKRKSRKSGRDYTNVIFFPSMS